MRQLENDGHMLVHACLPVQRRAEQIMAMPAAKRRWTAREGRALIAESPLATPRYELVDGVVKRPRYQEHIPEYWIFDLDARLVERWRSRGAAGDCRAGARVASVGSDGAVQARSSRVLRGSVR